MMLRAFIVMAMVFLCSCHVSAAKGITCHRL